MKKENKFVKIYYEDFIKIQEINHDDSMDIEEKIAELAKIDGLDVDSFREGFENENLKSWVTTDAKKTYCGDTAQDRRQIDEDDGGIPRDPRDVHIALQNIALQNNESDQD